MHVRMRSVLENLPTEIWFEIFDYLTTFDIFHAFLRLNQRINSLLGIYPLKLDCQSLSRSQFDFICRSIDSKQVLSLSLSDGLMPNQVQLFHQHFLHFQQEFRQLKTLKYLDTSTVLPALPPSLSSLSIKTYLKRIETDPLIIQTLTQQSQSLTFLQIDGAYIFRSIDHSFPVLTHLSIDYCTIKEFHRFLHSLKSPLTQLRVFLDLNDHGETGNISLLPNFGQLASTLSNLALTFSEDIVMSFTVIQQWIRELSRLISLTIQTTCTLDMMSGELWENFLVLTKIQNFNFKFVLANSITTAEDQVSLLEPFRSSFWTGKRGWYVVCEKGKFRSSRPVLYSIPYFQSTCIFHPSDHFLSKSTNDNEIFTSKHPISLILTFHQAIPLPNVSFNYVHSLTLIAATLPSIEILQSIVNLKQIQQLNVASVKTLSIELFQTLIDTMINLQSIRMQFNPLYVPPLHIYSYTFIREDQDISVIDANNIERFCYLFYHLAYVEITIQSQDILIRLLNRLHYLETIRIFSYQNYLGNIRYQWLIEHVPRLKTMDFTYRTTPTCLVLAIGNSKSIVQRTTERRTKGTTVKCSSLLKSCSPCKLQ